MNIFYNDFFLWDKKAFQFINGHHNGVADKLMWAVSSPYFGIAIFLVLSLYIFFILKKQSWKVIIYIAATVFIVDVLSARVVKPLAKRLRPSHDTEYFDDFQMHLHTKKDGKLYYGGPYGFPSNHAANFMTITTLFSFFINRQRKRPAVTISLLTITLLVGYSRIYLGVHYPFDVLCGWLLALIVSFLSIAIVRKKYYSRQ